ncbi:class A beta-lactamase-related serine hydrolase [Dyadobacter chenwenxiniae]|uniref:Class A beta-lactamase-related serine hydrolase n=1 Tax=Dyadobacter chenwenxiniae TaxID=2906456 RepID=A0A9X1PIM9_9BACT|nr:serine hydrolase [Dyadobacter chenwenxiniae]MCF0061396.1 class A beta-lactamase-related serine hydrolase [Dyadobacter chenwenxiniae]UON81218.1 class A beta-lactamase-related serine hydrolase [Dyadobacter chenwenxiniae]
MLLSLVALPSLAQFQADNFIEKLLKKHPERFAEVLKDPDKYQIQILYTKIDRNRKNEPQFTTHRYHVNSAQYFYPASTVKLPAVALAFEKLNKLGIDKNTPMFTGSDRPEQISVNKDSTAENGLPSVAHYAKKILLVSDNDAFNRLYEFIGQEEFNDSLRKKGFTNVRITHRLESPIGPENNRYTNPVRFEKDGKVILEQPAKYAAKELKSPEPILKGKGFMKDNELVNEPFDFSSKNYFALEDQHRLLKTLFFPDQVPASQRFDLTAEDYRFMYQYMSQFPVETSFPEHYTDDYYDGYAKFLLFGATKTRLPRHIRLFNKVGDAYGFLLDNAYIADFEKGIEFMLTAVIYCNEDEVFNDNKYDYEKIGFPFMADLGKTIFEYELNRKRPNRPDLSRFEVEYDK